MTDLVTYALVVGLAYLGVCLVVRATRQVDESPEERTLRLARQVHSTSRLRAGRWVHVDPDREDPS